jgi:hypothetical protein
MLCGERKLNAPPEHIRSSLTMTKSSDPIISEVSRLASEGQPNSYDRAYQALQNGFDNFLENERLCSPTQQVDQAKADQYWKDINNELSTRGFLPGLSVAYLRANFDRLDTQGRRAGDPSGPDGMLTHSEIRQEDGRNQVFARQFDEQMGRKDFFHQVAKMHDPLHTRKEIEHEDVDKYLRKQDKTNRKHEKQESARESMSPLFEEGDCGKPLLEYLNSRAVNGRVTVREMERFVNECDRRQNDQDATFNDKNRDYVMHILNGDMSWNRAGDGFQINKLARKGGFDALNMQDFSSHEDLKQNYDAAKEVFEEKTAPTAENFTPPTKCEEIEEEAAKNKVEKVEKTDKVGVVEVPDGIFTVKHGEGYWHVAKRLLSLNPEHKPSNQEIMHCMTVMMTQNSAHFAEKFPGYTPMLRPCDKVHCDINTLVDQVPAAKKYLRR